MGVVNRGYEQGRFFEGPGGFARMRRSQNNMAGKHSVLRELGIGTNDPATAMHVLSETAGGSITVERLQDTANPASIYLKKSRGNLVAQTVVQDDDNIGGLVVQGYVGANNGYQSMAHFQFEVDGSVTDAAYGAPSRMMLKLASGSALVERMRVEADGDVGIGNFSSVSPAGKLDVQGVIAISTEVSTPSQQAGIGKLYTKSDGHLYYISGDGDVGETDLTEAPGDITLVSITTDTGSGGRASFTSGNADFILLGGEGIDVTNSGATITVAGEEATTSNKGVASFHGDNFSVSSGAVTIKDQGVLYAEIQNVSATDRILGRDSSGAGSIEEITPGNLRTMINVADGAEVNESAFKTISVSGQDNVVADADADTLTFAAGTNVTITTTEASDTVTITAADTNTTYSPGTLLDVSGTTFNVDLTEASEQAIANGDYILFLDGGATGSHAKENIADVASLFAGDGLTASSAAMAVNVDDSTIEINSDAIRIKDNGVTLAKMAGLTRGSIIYGDASGNPAALGVGSNTYVLTSDGTDIAWSATGGDITSVVAGSGLTGGATSGDATVNVGAGNLIDVQADQVDVDLTEAAEAVLADGDYILFLDGGATGTHAKENIADVATLFAGDGLTASSSAMAVNVDDSTIEINSDAIRVKDNGVTLAKMAGITRGSIIYGDASGNPAALGVGSNTYVLTSDGTDIAWAAAGSGSGDITGVTIQTDTGSGSKASDTGGSADFILQGDSAGIDVTNSGTTITVALDLNEITAGVVADGDSFVFVDANDTNANKKESIADLASLFAGDGLTASSSVMAVNVDDSTIEINSDAIRVKDNGITLAKMDGLARGKIIHGDSGGNPAALALGSANTVLQSDGTDSSWGTVATAMIADDAVSLAKMAGLARGSIIYGDASGNPAALSAGNNTYVLTSDGTDISWASAGGGSARSVAGDTDNAIMTWVTSDNTFAAEANCTFDGSTLTVTGNVFVDGQGDVNQVKIQGHTSQSASPLLVENSGGTDVFEVTNTGKVIGAAGAEFKGNSFKMGSSGGSTNFIHATGANNLNFRNANANKDLQFDISDSNGTLNFRTHDGGSPGTAVVHTSLVSDGVLTHNAAMVATGDAVFKGDTDAALLVVDAGDERVGVSVAAGSMRHRFDCRGSRGYEVNVLAPSGAGHAYTVTESDAIIYADASGLDAGTTLTITLPAIALGRIYEVYRKDAAAAGQSVVVAAPSGTNMNGSSAGTVTLGTQYEGVRIVGIDPTDDWIAHEMHLIDTGGGGGGGGGP